MSRSERSLVSGGDRKEGGSMRRSTTSIKDIGSQQEEGELYFEPKRVYRAAPESSSRSSLVRVYSENESANFDQVTGSRMYDDLKHRPIPITGRIGANTDGSEQTLQAEPQRARKRRFSWNQQESDMQDEYIPEFDFAEAVLKWQSEDGESPAGLSNRLANNSANATPPKYIETITRFNTWSTEHEANSDSVSPNSSYVFDSSHAQVDPIPLPNAASKVPMMGHMSATDVDKNTTSTAAHSGDLDRFKSMGFNNSFQGKKLPRRRTSVGDSFNSASSSLTQLPDNAVSIISELKMTPEEVIELIGKLPHDFLFLPYSQRKKIIVDLIPNKDYKMLMSLIKKFMLKSSKSSTSLTRNSLPDVAAAGMKSRHGSVASQFLSSFSPAGVNSVAGKNSFRPDDKGMEIMGYNLGKVIGFGAWGMIRECHDVVTGADRAMKIVRFRNNPKVKRQVLKEVSVWQGLKDENILPLIQWKLDDDYAMYCLTEKVRDGTLYDLVISWGEFGVSKIDFKSRCQLTILLCLQLVSALRYLHDLYIAHGDVKLENCLLEKAPKLPDWKVLLCDFGMSCRFSHSNKPPIGDDTMAESWASPTAHDNSETLSSLKNRKVTTHDFKSMPINRSRSSTNVRTGNRLTKLQRIVKNRKLTHDDTPLGISSLPKTYGPSLTSARMTNSSTPSLRNLASQTTKLTPVMDMTSPHTTTNAFPVNVGPDPHSHIGSLPYASPELLEPSPPPLGPSADIWALGVTLYTMLTGKLPFKHDYEPRMRAMIASGKFDRRSLETVCRVKTDEHTGVASELQSQPGFPGLYNAIVGCLENDMGERWELNKIEAALKSDLMNLSTLV